MKLKNLLLSGMCALSFSAIAAEQGTILYHETFGENPWHQGTANATGEMKAGSEYYLNEPVFIHGDYSNSTNRTWPNASGGSVLGFDVNGAYTHLTIKLNTSEYPYALFSFAHCWDNFNCSYSENLSDWTPLSRDNAQTSAYGDWTFTQFSENIGGKNVVYVRIEATVGTPQVDDPMVTGYSTEPINTFALSGAIATASNFVNEAIMDAAYCMTDILNFRNNDIAAAQTVLDNVEATQTDVDNATSTLNAALEAIQATKLDFEAINAAITAAQAKMAEDGYAELYTEESRTIMENALTAAQQITEAGCVSQEDVNTAATTLSEAVNNLQNTAIDGNAAVAEINLYPSPADNFIKIDGVEGVTVNIFNSVGQLVKSVANYNGGTISISNLASGVYSAVINDTTISFIKK